jgi:response regulator RpfG family c-di-GMP phosphodiesterase
MSLEQVPPADATGGPEAAAHLTVLHSRQVSDLDLLQSDLVGADGRAADLFLRFVRETSCLSNDEEKLLSVVSDFTFQAFPQATHFALVLASDASGQWDPLMVRSRIGDEPEIGLSRTLVRKVMGEGLSLLYTQGDDGTEVSESIRLSRINAAICAPLVQNGLPFGVLQLDIRNRAGGTFGRKDVDRLALFAHHVALVLDNMRLCREQREALDSTIDALVHSLYLKDPDTALHSQRVRAISLHVGRKLGLSILELDALGIAALLHDLGKQGISDAVLLKPASLTKAERTEMSRHSGLTEDILGRIRFPAHLHDVPLYAAYHHEKMDGSGPYGLAGEQIPIHARIISVADVFDALLSARVYKKPLSLTHALSILREGAGREWDPAIIELVAQDAREILEETSEFVPYWSGAPGPDAAMDQAA